jgi:hypothetical protein
LPPGSSRRAAQSIRLERSEVLLASVCGPDDGSTDATKLRFKNSAYSDGT